jgi:hypothetical protein
MCFKYKFLIFTDIPIAEFSIYSAGYGICCIRKQTAKFEPTGEQRVRQLRHDRGGVSSPTILRRRIDVVDNSAAHDRTPVYSLRNGNPVLQR